MDKIDVIYFLKEKYLLKHFLCDIRLRNSFLQIPLVKILKARSGKRKRDKEA